MKTYTIRKYQKKDGALWNSFINDSINGTFLFHRDFMEYHQDRFVDFSLLIYDGIKLIGLFPANIVDNHIHSHQGLTYGGLILKERIGGKKIRDIVSDLIAYCRSSQVATIFIKSIPIFYHKQPSNSFIFFLSAYNTTLYRRDLNLAIDYSLPLDIHKSKRKHFEKGKDIGFHIEEVNDCSIFWDQILIPRLREKHEVGPVHSVAEIMLLKNKFPAAIKQFTISLDGETLAGITIFKTDRVVKSQYGAVSTNGQKYRALDFLFITLINKYKDAGYAFFDMGTVTENNFGLLKQKEELGCKIYTQDFYKLDLM